MIINLNLNLLIDIMTSYYHIEFHEKVKENVQATNLVKSHKNDHMDF